MKPRWKARILSRRTLVRSEFFHVVEERIEIEGKRFRYVFRAHGPVVHVIPLTAAGEVVLARQYRHPPRRVLLELPAGVVDSGETILGAARRELAEETGYVARRWVRMGGWLPAPSSSDMVTHYCLALGCRRASPQKLDEFEFIEVERRPLRTMLRRFGRTRNTTANTLLGLSLAERYLKKRRSRLL